MSGGHLPSAAFSLSAPIQKKKTVPTPKGGDHDLRRHAPPPLKMNGALVPGIFVLAGRGWTTLLPSPEGVVKKGPACCKGVVEKIPVSPIYDECHGCLAYDRLARNGMFLIMPHRSIAAFHAHTECVVLLPPSFALRASRCLVPRYCSTISEAVTDEVQEGQTARGTEFPFLQISGSKKIVYNRSGFEHRCLTSPGIEGGFGPFAKKQL